MYLIGYDIGSSSVKASLMEVSTGKTIASDFFPKHEMPILSSRSGWAEQNPSDWWDNLRMATASVMNSSGRNKEDIKAIGISYQMHGLVIIDKNHEVLRPSIIWCDSRAVDIGDKAFKSIGNDLCLQHLLNSPGNFTASKLKWVKQNEPDIYERIHKIMLPGDYVAMRLTGDINTTISGLSEGILWDFKDNMLAKFILGHYEISESLIPSIVPTFEVQGLLSGTAAKDLGLNKGTPVAYRAGDQPNNAFSLNVLNPGEVAATAGTSGVVYGVSDEVKYDPLSRVNTFAHVNHTEKNTSLGVLLCINGTGSLNSWIKRNIAGKGIDYDSMNSLAASVPAGSGGIGILPFGNGAERMLGNADPGCHIFNLNFNIHNQSHLLRAAQEGIVFAFQYGMKIMQETGINPSVIRAGNANMFLSPIFREALATISGARIELYNTDGATGAARGAGLGAGIYSNFEEAFGSLTKIQTIEPENDKKDMYAEAYSKWLEHLNKYI